MSLIGHPSKEMLKMLLTLTTKLEKRIEVLKIRSFRILLGISYIDRVTSGEIKNRTRQAIGSREDLLTTARGENYNSKVRIKIIGLAKTFLQGSVNEKATKEDEESGGKMDSNGAPKIDQTAG